jgi:hypothetical protein
MAHPVNEINNNNNEMMEQFRRLNQIRIQIEFACLSFSVSALLVKKQTFFCVHLFPFVTHLLSQN